MESIALPEMESASIHRFRLFAPGIWGDKIADHADQRGAIAELGEQLMNNLSRRAVGQALTGSCE